MYKYISFEAKYQPKILNPKYLLDMTTVKFHVDCPRSFLSNADMLIYVQYDYKYKFGKNWKIWETINSLLYEIDITVY